jgi:hypothetical protein
VQIAETCIDPSDVEFSLLTEGSVIGIQLFIPGLRENDVTVKQIGYLMLDAALGEYDVETKVGLIQMLPPECPRTTQRYAFSELSSFFDQLASRLVVPALPN